MDQRPLETFLKPLLLLKILEEGVALKGDLRRLFEEASRGAGQLIEVKH